MCRWCAAHGLIPPIVAVNTVTLIAGIARIARVAFIAA
ncbi:MAG: hypothetical protein RLZZ502_765 [Pseudomonadota bacterium]